MAKTVRGCGQMIKKSWFILDLYTPTPPEYTDDFIYMKEDENGTITDNVEGNPYTHTAEHYVYDNKPEVIHIEF